MGSWNTPDAKIESVLRDLIEQEEQDDLRGWNVITRFSQDRKAYPQIAVVCRQVSDAQPQAIEATGNWIAEVEVSVKSIIRRTTGAQHDATAGHVTDLLMRRAIVTQLNTLAEDEEIQFLSGRMIDRINGVDDANDRQETLIRWRVQVTPYRTEI